MLKCSELQEADNTTREKTSEIPLLFARRS